MVQQERTKEQQDRCQELRNALDELLAQRVGPIAVQPYESLTEVPDPTRNLEPSADVEEQIRQIQDVMTREGCS